MLAVVLFDQIRSAVGAQYRSLLHSGAEVDHTGAKLLPEIDRINLQILEFYEHWFGEHWNVNPPPPPLKLPQRPAEVHAETKVSQGAICKDKGLKTECQGRENGVVS